MREYETGKKDTLIISNVVCNACGKEISIIGDGVRHDYFHAEKKWGYFSNRDGEEERFDICEECYKKIIDDFLISPR